MVFRLQHHLGKGVFPFWPLLEIPPEEGCCLVGLGHEEGLIERQRRGELLGEMEGGPPTILFQQVEIFRSNRMAVGVVETSRHLPERQAMDLTRLA